MASTFRDIWGLVSLHVPVAPTSLVQHWTQLAYDRLIGKRHWGWTRRDVLLSTRAARTVTINVTQGSTTLTGVAQFVATDVGRQIRVSQGPTYTINTYTDANTVALTQAYGGDSGAVSATLSDVYLLMPADFRSIFDVTDLTTQRPIAWWIGADRLDAYDPARIASDSRFRVLAAATHSQVTAYLGRVTYEAWPRPTAAGTYRLQYFLRSDVLDDETTLPGLLATYGDSLRTGALAEAAQWPGTTTQKNPYFNLPLARELKAQFYEAVKAIDVMDDDQYLLDLQQLDLSKFGLAAVSADPSLLRMTDAGAGDYYGGYGGGL